MIKCVVDSSAVLAWTDQEAGFETLESFIYEAGVSSVNLTEIVSKLLARGASSSAARARVEAVGLEVIPFDKELAIEAGELYPITRRAGLSLGDRACIVTARKFGLPVITADRVWAGLPLGVTVHVVG